MKALLAALVLAASSPAFSASVAPAQISVSDEVEVTANICIGLLTDKISSDEVIKGLNLDTDAKKREFMLHCALYIQGVNDGIEVSKNKLNRTSLINGR